MQEPESFPSLLETLAPTGGPLRLNLSWSVEDQPEATLRRTPFFLVSDSDPLTGVYRGRFETGAGSVISSVFLLKQKDRYRQAASPLERLTNLDVEQFWRNAAHRLSRFAPRISPVFLAGQTAADGTLLPFRPLFHCRIRKAYFHPPCPRCGQELTLCLDDAWLASHGLQPYSTSLNRFLHCPQCRESHSTPQFFVYEAGPFDPAAVLDRFGLIREWSRGIKDGVLRTGLPCMDCSLAGECLRIEGEIENELTPFGFYPFYLMAFEAPTFQALDFLCVVSGGSLEQLETRLAQRGEIGKVHHLKTELQERPMDGESSFFFRGSPKFFLEVLYLKLAFLGEVARIAVFEPGGPGLIDMAGSLDRIWVGLPGQSHYLPRLWNFDVRFLDIFRGAPGVPVQMKLPPAFALHLMGVLWLTGLLSNQNQDGSVIQQAIDTLYSDEVQSSTDASSATVSPHALHPVFAPGNIFWNPEARELPESWSGLWHESLELGWSLMRTAYRMGADWSPERFRLQLAALLQRVKEQLFSAPGPTERVLQSEDTALAEILAGILKSWEDEDASPPASPLRAGDTAPTVSELETLPLELTQEIPEEWGPETVILPPPTATGRQPAQPAHAGVRETESPETEMAAVQGDYDVGETVVLRSREQQAHEEEVLPETVILSPGARSGIQPSSETEGARGRTDEPDLAVQDLERPEEERRRPAVEEEELLMETVILSPKKDTDK